MGEVCCVMNFDPTLALLCVSPPGKHVGMFGSIYNTAICRRLSWQTSVKILRVARYRIVLCALKALRTWFRLAIVGSSGCYMVQQCRFNSGFRPSRRPRACMGP